MRDQGVDIDTLSEHLHRTTDPDAPIPSKSEDHSGFMSPLIHAVVSKLKEISPTKQDTQALRELQLVQGKLKETEEKLRQSQKSQRTPSLPEVETPSSRPAVGSQDPEEDPIEPFEEQPPQAASKKRKDSAIALGASPKAKTQRGLEAWVRRSDQVPQPKALLTAEEVMNPSKPVIRDQQPKSGSQGDIKKWMEQFDVETQQTAKKILEMLADHKLFQGKTAECSSPVRTQRPRLLEVPTHEESSAGATGHLTSKFFLDHWIKAVQWHGDSKVAAFVNTAEEWADVQKLLTPLENIVAKQDTVVWSSTQKDHPAIPKGSLPFKLVVRPENDIQRRIQRHLPDTSHVEATGLGGLDLSYPIPWDISIRSDKEGQLVYGPSLAPLEETVFVSGSFGGTETLQVSALGRSKAAHEFLVLHYFALDSAKHWDEVLTHVLPAVRSGVLKPVGPLR